jgi:suppressor of ftsI
MTGRSRVALFSAATLVSLALGSARIAATSAAGSAEIVPPPEVHSTNGTVTVNLTAAVNPSTGLPALQYNGVIGPMGPTIRINPGETLNVNYVNHLPATGGMCAMSNIVNGVDYMDNTNLHYHGMKVSPNPPSDQIITTLLAPGQTYAYSVPVPVDDAPGLYWYHAHPHCESNRQVTGGLAGTLIVNGIEKYYPQVANMPERILVLQNQIPAGGVVVDLKQRAARNKMLHAQGAARAAAARALTGQRNTAQSTTTNPDCLAPAAYTVSLNGQPVDPPATPPQISIAPGQKQFWRVANESANAGYDIALIGPNGQRAPFQVIGRDGQPLSYHDPGQEYVQVTDYVLMPAARVELIATGPSGPGWTFQTLCVDTGPAGDPTPQRLLATINPHGYNGPAALAANDNIPALQKPPFNILTYPVAQRRTMVFSEDSTGTNFFINGQQFNPTGAPMVTAKVGTVEEWTIINTATEIHAFHIHQIHFLVESIGGRATGPDEEYLDTVILPISNGQPNSNVVKLLMDFTDPIIVGTFVFHCHILEHEDGGMMAKIQIVQ